MFVEEGGRESWPLKYGCLRYLYVKLVGNDSDQPSSDYGRSFAIVWSIQTFTVLLPSCPQKDGKLRNSGEGKKKKELGPRYDRIVFTNTGLL